MPHAPCLMPFALCALCPLWHVAKGQGYLFLSSSYLLCRRATSHNSYKHRRRPNVQLVAKRQRTEEGGPCIALPSLPDGVSRAVPPHTQLMRLSMFWLDSSCLRSRQQPSKVTGRLRGAACRRRHVRQSRRTGLCGGAEAACSATWRRHWHRRAQGMRRGSKLPQMVAHAVVRLARRRLCYGAWRRTSGTPSASPWPPGAQASHGLHLSCCRDSSACQALATEASRSICELPKLIPREGLACMLHGKQACDGMWLVGLHARSSIRQGDSDATRDAGTRTHHLYDMAGGAMSWQRACRGEGAAAARRWQSYAAARCCTTLRTGGPCSWRARRRRCALH